MNNLKKFAVNPTGRLHLRGADDEKLYAEGPDGQPDKSRPIVAIIYGPGSEQYARAQAAQNNTAVERLRQKGKVDQTAEEAAEEKAKFLVGITQGIENLLPTEPVTTDPEQLHSVFTDRELGFIGDQIHKYGNDWANFKKPSIKA